MYKIDSAKVRKKISVLNEQIKEVNTTDRQNKGGRTYLKSITPGEARFTVHFQRDVSRDVGGNNRGHLWATLESLKQKLNWQSISKVLKTLKLFVSQ